MQLTRHLPAWGARLTLSDRRVRLVESDGTAHVWTCESETAALATYNACVDSDQRLSLEHRGGGAARPLAANMAA